VTLLGPLLSSLPSPGSEVLEIGPISLRFYGIMIAVGVLVGVWVAQHRWQRWGGDTDDIVTVAIWAVPAGLVGARLYHVLTDWGDKYDEGRWLEAFKIWQGGLGIPGAILLGAVVGILVARRLVPQWRLMADAAAPAIPIAQAIGRFGNWFNQELYGRPTDLPWALQIDIEKRPVAYVQYETFHPTFLYEGLWNLSLAGFIIWGSSRWVLKPGRWFAVYVLGYGTGRLWVESLRIDEATMIAGLRVNIWMSLVIITGGLLWLLWGGGPLDAEATARLRAGESFLDILGPFTRFVPLEGAGGVGGESGESGESGEVGEVVGSPTDEEQAGTANPVGEPGPETDSPLAEGAVADDDAPDAGGRLEPEERP
jgi:prolipoprotein diacylglyceryl transferase